MNLKRWCTFVAFGLILIYFGLAGCRPFDRMIFFPDPITTPTPVSDLPPPPPLIRVPRGPGRTFYPYSGRPVRPYSDPAPKGSPVSGLPPSPPPIVLPPGPGILVPPRHGIVVPPRRAASTRRHTSGGAAQPYSGGGAQLYSGVGTSASGGAGPLIPIHLTCENCGQHFENVADMGHHLMGGKTQCDKFIRQAQGMYNCPECGRKCETPSKLTRHLAVHYPWNRQRCEFCNKTLFDFTSLKRHKKTCKKIARSSGPGASMIPPLGVRSNGTSEDRNLGMKTLASTKMNSNRLG